MNTVEYGVCLDVCMCARAARSSSRSRSHAVHRRGVLQQYTLQSLPPLKWRQSTPIAASPLLFLSLSPPSSVRVCSVCAPVASVPPASFSSLRPSSCLSFHRSDDCHSSNCLPELSIQERAREPTNDARARGRCRSRSRGPRRFLLLVRSTVKGCSP